MASIVVMYGFSGIGYPLSNKPDTAGHQIFVNYKHHLASCIQSNFAFQNWENARLLQLLHAAN